MTDFPSQWKLKAGCGVELASPSDGGGESPTLRRRFKMEAFTGRPVMTSLGQVGFEMQGMEFSGETMPALQQHNPLRIAGQIDEINMGTVVELSGTLMGPVGREIAELSDDGFKWQASLGLTVLELEEVKEGETRMCNGFQLQGPAFCATKTIVNESSFVPLGADNMTRAVALDGSTPVEMVHKEEPMTEMSPAPATIAELKQAFPDDSDFVLSCVEGEMTMLEAEAAYGKKLRVELEKRNLRISQLEEQVGRPDAPTTQATESTSVDGNMRSWQGSAIHEWDKRLREARASGMSRDKAVRSVALADQDLHKAYLDEFNLSYPRKG